MVALVGDAELDEGNIFECLLEGWKQGLRNCWWMIDYNRQSLDAVVREGLYQRITALFEAMGWEVRVLKYGSLLEDGVSPNRAASVYATGSTARPTSSTRRSPSRAAPPGGSASSTRSATRDRSRR